MFFSFFFFFFISARTADEADEDWCVWRKTSPLVGAEAPVPASSGADNGYSAASVWVDLQMIGVGSARE